MRKALRKTYYLIEKSLISHGFINKKIDYFPDFLCIGAQKSGTTWLYQNLCKHEELFLPDEKELHYFNLNYHTSINYYESYFRSKGNRIGGEITPAYSTLSKRKIKLIKRLFPELKLIFILRNPIERAWSQAKMHLGKEYNCTILELPEDIVLKQFNSKHALERGRYENTIMKWSKFYDQNHLLILDYEDIKRQPTELLREVFEFLSVIPPKDYSTYPYEEKIFSGSDEVIPKKYFNELKKIYGPTINFVKKRYQSKFKTW